MPPPPPSKWPQRIMYRDNIYVHSQYLKKNVKNIFFVLIKHQSMTHVSTSIFQGFFRNIRFRSVALVTKKLWAI